MKKLLIITAFFAVGLGVQAFAQSCSGSQVSCCKNGQMSCCANPGRDSNGNQLSYDLSGCMVSELQCSDGYWAINGRCEPMLQVCMEGYKLINGKCEKIEEAIEFNPTCKSFTSEAGHTVPTTDQGKSVQMGCYTYTCVTGSSSLLGQGTWSTSSNCECKPGATYYQPCDDCGTQSRTCSTQGTFGAWGACSAS